MRMSGARTRVSLWVLIFVACLTSVLPVSNAFAAQITTRSLKLQPNAVAVAANKPSSSAPSVTGHADSTGKADDLFTFTAPSSITSSIRSIQFQYCTAAFVTGATCVAPTDLSTTTATMGTAATLTSPTFTSTAANIGYVATTANTSSTTMAITIVGVYNPSAPNKTFYVWISTFVAANATGTPIDQGTVAASTATPIILNGTMPESLTFCTAATITVVPVTLVPDCTGTTTGAPANGTVLFNQLFDPNSTATATSQMAASTNAASGYIITYYGDTLKTGGSNPITAMTTAAVPAVNSSQFGLNLVANTHGAGNNIPGAAADVGILLTHPTGTGFTYSGVVDSPYATAGTFQFIANTATQVAHSTAVSDAQVYTVAYIVDVIGSQAAGLYTTTLTYVCTPTY